MTMTMTMTSTGSASASYVAPVPSDQSFQSRNAHALIGGFVGVFGTLFIVIIVALACRRRGGIATKSQSPKKEVEMTAAAPATEGDTSAVSA